jgi:hypothetical protein
VPSPLSVTIASRLCRGGRLTGAAWADATSAKASPIADQTGMGAIRGYSRKQWAAGARRLRIQPAIGSGVPDINSRKREPTAAILPKPSRDAPSTCAWHGGVKGSPHSPITTGVSNIMNRLLIAVALAALSTPALARGEAGPDDHSYVQPTSEQHQNRQDHRYKSIHDSYRVFVPRRRAGAE